MFKDPTAVKQMIEAEVKDNPVLLFVKGSREFPQCGFSKGVMDVFDDLGVTYKTIDVLSDPLIRDGIKQFTQWPTIPQVFVKGEFIGGFDIVRDLYSRGELKTIVQGAGA